MLVLAMSNAAYVLTAYVVTTVTARVLGPEDFGSFGVVMAWITVLTALLVKGLSTSITRAMAAGEVDQAAAWRAGRSLGIRLSLGLAVLGIAGSSLAASAFGARDLTEHFAVGALGALTFGINAVLLAWPTGRRDYRRQATAQVAYAVARLALVVGGALAFGLEGAVIGYVLAPLVSSASILARVPATTVDLAPIRAAMLRHVIPVALTSIAISAWFVVDVFAVSATLGEASLQLGAYVAFGTIAHVPFFLLQATSVAIVPALAGAGDAAARTRAVRRTLTDTTVLLAGPTLLLVTAGDAAARLVFGDEFHVDGLVAAPLAIATAAVTLLSALVAVNTAIGQLRFAIAVNAVGIAALAVLCVAAGSRDGAGAADVAWVVVPVSVVTMLVLAGEVALRQRGLLEWKRAAIGVAAAGVLALPPLLVGDDLLRTITAGACALAWLAIVLRSGLVDVSRRVSVAPAAHAEQAQRPG